MNSHDSLEKLENFAIVLVQPLGAGNVGSIARTMGHFGISDLRLVSPRCDVKSVEARSMAMSAQPLLAEAQHFATLREAIEDCGWAVATSRRLGRNRKPTLSPRQDAPSLLQRAKEARVAIVFGREDKGLRTDEVDQCQERLLIPAMPKGDSFNLSQAALLVLWELFMGHQPEARLASPERNPKKGDELAPREKIEGLVDHLVATLEMIGFIPHHHPIRVARSFRGLVDRVQPTDREVRMMRGVLRQITWTLSNGTMSTDPTPDSQDSSAEPLPEESPALEAKRNERLIRNL